MSTMMAPIMVFWVLVLIWTIINLVRVILAIFWPVVLQRLQCLYGISIGVCSITYHTKYFNRRINTFQPQRSFSPFQYSVYQKYFSAGVWLALVMLPYALYTIVKSVVYSSEIVNYVRSLAGFISSNVNQTMSNQVGTNKPDISTEGFMIVVPGISIPFHECIYFILAVAISSVIHEMGHAFAANRHNLKIEGVGISIFLCLPVTFVSIQSVKEPKSNLFGQLEVVSAGLLNNAVLCLVALGLFVLNPLALLYTSAGGLVVTSVDPLSSISQGPNRLMAYDTILSINSHSIKSFDDWTSKLNAIASYQNGFCVSRDFLERHALSKESFPCHFDHCCDNEDRSLCFLMHTPTANYAGDTEQDDYASCDLIKQFAKSNLNRYFKEFIRLQFDQNAAQQFCFQHRKICLPARPVVEGTTQFCNQTLPCLDTYFGHHSCLHPYSSHSLTRLIVIEVATKSTNILFFGPPAELYQAVRLSAIRPRLWLIPILTYQQMNIFYRYLFSISFSLILFNLLPYNPFDGYHIFSLASIYLFGDGSSNVRQQILKVVNFVSTILVLMCVLVGLIQLRNFIKREGQM